MIAKWNIHKHMYNYEKKQNQGKRLNMLNHKKVFKTTYFIARKKWAVQENFADIIDFLKDIRDEDILKAFSWM